ncbi:MAG: type I restriction endonuclease subunit R [Candidatus Nanosyncoccus sp. P13S_S20_bin.18.1]|nr:type I restriction endonuclease subunit R [Candidatus Nanosyncoccus sp. P13S_S20_bin.18.1]
MSKFNIIAESEVSTVLTEYKPDDRKYTAYQSEAELERELIQNLQEQGYEYLQTHNAHDLEDNLRIQLQKLNNYIFSDSEWQRFFYENIVGNSEGVVEKTRKVQEKDTAISFRAEDGHTQNIRLLDKKNIHNNSLQVINQYAVSKDEGAEHDNRYDVTILVNGLPIVHIELKRRGVRLREAFNQIKRYSRESFFAGSGLFEYVQIFVISNGTHTKYYSNTTRESHIKELGEAGRKKSKKTSNSFEFTSYWADAKNKTIPDLVDFTKTFFSKHTILNILTRYCVFDTDNKLLVMRPYQIVATERIINRIETSTNYKKLGTTAAGGYIWHTTGSGKTLTSFKTAQLVAKMPYIDKVLFVVDRKDLDYQTMKEYDRFEKGAADGNTSTRVLQRQLESDNSRIIVTTIQKLGVFTKKNPEHDIYNKHVVIIFDECHRSQFGDMHTAIAKAFKNYHLFGFTGTPIFASNAGNSGNPMLRTTEQAFGDKLHTYTIVDAINDKNVLPFRIDYINTVKEKDDIADKQVSSIDREHALLSGERVSMVTSYILDHFDQKTKRNQFYNFNRTMNVADVVRFGDSKRETLLGRMNGFNSIFAVASIPAAMKYYTEFKKQLAERNDSLKIATIFSFAANEDDPEEGFIFDEDLDVTGMDQSSRDFLESVIANYNKDFNTNYDTSSDSFQNYYKDLSLRVKNREVDLLIVVNMFLTGFDATTLNTLWVDKELKMHGLVQAFSRTNRILNSVKQFGNIICFRNLAEKVDEAIGLFGDRDASGIVLLKSYDEYLNGYDENGEHKVGYTELIAELSEKFPLGEQISGEQNQKDFIKLFGKILRMRNILTSFDRFEQEDILSPRDLQNYQSEYLDLYQELRPSSQAEKEDVNDDLVFEIELVRQAEVNVDYILALVAKYHESNCENKDILTSIDKAVDASIELRSKKELIHDFINLYSLRENSEIHDAWQRFINVERENELTKIIEDNNLNPAETRRLIINSFRDGVFKTTGTDVDRIMPAMSRFGNSNRSGKKKGVIERLVSFFEKYFGAI